MRSDVVAASGGVTNGLYDFLARELPPTQGRWVSPDPAGIGAVTPANPQRWNRYSYLANSPMMALDPTGLVPMDPKSLRKLVNYCSTGTAIGIGYIEYDGPCLYTGLAKLEGQNNVLDTIMGNTIFDAIQGAPGTFLTVDERGNIGFGFSDALWSQTLNTIDEQRAKAEDPNSTVLHSTQTGQPITDGNGNPIVWPHDPVHLGSYPWSGWQVVVNYDGEASGLLFDYVKARSQVDALTIDMFRSVWPWGGVGSPQDRALSWWTDRLATITDEINALALGDQLGP